MKTLEYIFQDTQIHFLLQNEGEVMVNATEMGKAFNKEPKDFLRLEGTKKYIDALLKKKNIVADLPRYSKENIVYSNNKAGTYMTRKLALEFASWLDVDFKIWIWDVMDELIFGNYKKHWDAHLVQEKAKDTMEVLKQKLLVQGGIETAVKYFEAEKTVKESGKIKKKAISTQMKLNLTNYGLNSQ